MKSMFLQVLLCMGFGVLAQSPGFELKGISSAVVPVTVDKMTNLVFPEAVLTGVKVSKDILAQKVKGVENVIELKAVKPGFLPTNLSVYGRDGRLYSFLLRYVADTDVLNFRVMGESGEAPVMVSGLPVGRVKLRADAYWLMGHRSFLRVFARSQRLRFGLRGVYLRDSLEWLVLTVRNGSAWDLGVERMRLFVEDRKRVKRKAIQEVPLEPVYDGRPEIVGGRRLVKFAVGLKPVVIGGGKRLVLVIEGTDGRRVELRVKGKVLLKAKV